MEWSIQDIVRTTGTTSRTLRHYDELGLLRPTRIGGNGHRYYDQTSLVRLQRILLLRQLGLGLPAIAEVLAGQQDTSTALREHLHWLQRERNRLAQQITSVQTTIDKLERGEPLVAQEVFDGFDHTQYKDEVIERWGREAYQKGDHWWRSLNDAERRTFQQEQHAIAQDFGAAKAAGAAADSAQVQEITERLFHWLSGPTTVTKQYFIGLGQLYVDDPRFTAHYDRYAAGSAELIRDAMKIYAEKNLME